MGLSSLFGGGLSASSSSKSGDQSAAIEAGLSSSFVVGDGNKTSSGASDSLSELLPFALIGGGLLLVTVYLLKK